jgi:hypothetical protein
MAGTSQSWATAANERLGVPSWCCALERCDDLRAHWSSVYLPWQLNVASRLRSPPTPGPIHNAGN